MLLDKIPVVRGWLARWRNKEVKDVQLDAYAHLMRCIRNTPVSGIHFDHSGCAYTLQDGRSFYFNPKKSAGWLYSVPFTGKFEEKETEFVRQMIKQDWVCLDIGACFGWYSILFSQLVGRTGEVHAFEPVPDNRDCLQANLALNHCTNVKVNPFALGEQPTTTEIFIPHDGVSGSLRAHAKLDDCKAIKVEVDTLDQYAASNGLQRLDFIKADIEGAEFLMLKGAEQTLSKYRPTLMLEVQGHSTRLFGYEPADLFAWLQKLGYRAYYVNQHHELVYCDGLTELPDYNFVFKFHES